MGFQQLAVLEAEAAFRTLAEVVHVFHDGIAVVDGDPFVLVGGGRSFCRCHRVDRDHVDGNAGGRRCGGRPGRCPVGQGLIADDHAFLDAVHAAVVDVVAGELRVDLAVLDEPGAVVVRGDAVELEVDDVVLDVPPARVVADDAGVTDGLVKAGVRAPDALFVFMDGELLGLVGAGRVLRGLEASIFLGTFFGRDRGGNVRVLDLSGLVMIDVTADEKSGDEQPDDGTDDDAFPMLFFFLFGHEVHLGLRSGLIIDTVLLGVRSVLCCFLFPGRFDRFVSKEIGAFPDRPERCVRVRRFRFYDFCVSVVFQRDAPFLAW